MKEEAEEAEAHRLQMFFSLPPLQEGRGLNQTRRWLCRLWTAANHAVMKGFCLLSLQLGHRA